MSGNVEKCFETDIDTHTHTHTHIHTNLSAQIKHQTKLRKDLVRTISFKAVVTRMDIGDI